MSVSTRMSPKYHTIYLILVGNVSVALYVYVEYCDATELIAK